MIITRIIKLKNKAKIFFNDNSSITIRYDVVVKNGFRKGDEINDEFISSLLNQNESFIAKETAFRLLTRRPHSRKELERKLLTRKFNRDTVTAIVIDLEKNHYVDDEKFSRDFTEEKQNKKHLGKNRIKAQLKERGVSDEIINNTLGKRTEDEEFENAVILAEKKLLLLKKREDDKRRKIQKIHSYLQLRGFNYDIIRRVIDHLLKPEYND